jgi:hypothetical protein
LEDSDAEFMKLDGEQRNKVKFVDFIKKIDGIQMQISNSDGLLKNSRVLREKDESNMRLSQSHASESKRRITRKSTYIIFFK